MFSLTIIYRQARKDADSSKIALREKECSLQALLTQLSLSQDECKRVRHQYQLLECSSAHTRLQNRLSSVSTTAVNAALGVGVGVGVGMGLSADGGPLSFSKTAHEDGILLSNMKGASAPQLGTGVGTGTGVGVGAGVAVHLLTQDLDKGKVQQQKYGIEAVLGLQASNDVLRQELYHEKGDRARDKTTLSLALAEATARAVLADTVAADCRSQSHHSHLDLDESRSPHPTPFYIVIVDDDGM